MNPATEEVMIMAAPNGSRWTKEHHPALPVTINEISEETSRCYTAGAAISHVHVRDKDGQHVLDAGLYRELIDEIAKSTPDILVQITTEAVGRYSPEHQRSVVYKVEPDMVSIALREMIPTKDCEQNAAHFYAWAAEAQIHIQHILYSKEDVLNYTRLCAIGVIPPDPSGVLYVLGRYADGLIATPDELTPLLEASETSNSPWFCCAFGPAENHCIKNAIQNGGHARVGFENNFKLANGSTAHGTSSIVEQTVLEVQALGKRVSTSKGARKLLWHKG